MTVRDRTYGEILRLPELLTTAHVGEGRPDLMFFLLSHQTCEMWFALILQHLEAAQEAMADGRPADAAEPLDRLPMVLRVLVAQFDALTSLSPEAFEGIRTELGSASGIQSAQFRQIELLCGLRGPGLLRIGGFSPAEQARLTECLARPSIADTLDGLAVRFRDAPAGSAARAAWDRLTRALLEFDESVVVWRARHASLAERFIGNQRGTGGTDGSSYLWGTTQRRLFPQVWPVAR